MKKLFVLFAALAVFAGQILAAPVDVNTAKALGAKYLKNNVESAKNMADLQHVYTLSNENEIPYLYVFNHENGYVVVAADDRAYPILGYGDGVFDVNNIPDGLQYYLGHYGRQIQYAIDNELVAEPDVVEQWELLRKEGIIMRTRMEKAVQPLLETTWDQSWPYNYYAPTSSSWYAPGGHCYAGCVATAMSQVMKFWNWPETGVGEHSYNTSSNPGNGAVLYANFGETTYNWSIMPNQLGSQANAAAQAVAVLMYHCGIAVDMNYAPDGSGAYSENVPPALREYFRYGTCAYIDSRDDYTKSAWEDKLIGQLDRGIPLYYAGSGNNGGHAFNCDGYNDQRYFHFNFGWSGAYNNYYQIDALNTSNGTFNSYQSAVFDIIPDYIYDAMVPEISTLEAYTNDAMTKTVNVTFTVPTISESGAPLTSIEKITIKRNGTLVKTYTNPEPGAQLTYEDEVPEYGNYKYTISGENFNIEGKQYSTFVIVGPNCTWKVVCSTTNFQGWNDGKLSFVGANGVVFKTVTMTSSSPLSDKFQMAEGNFMLKWEAPTSNVPSLTITLKNSANEAVYNFSGPSTQLSGTIYSGNNDCPSCTPPTDFAGEFTYQNGVSGTLLTWNCTYSPSKFKVYRSNDGVEYTEIASIDGTSAEYFDAVDNGTYYYKVTAYSSACESTPAETANGTDYVVVDVMSIAENSINAIVYPNPADGKIMIQAEDITEVTIFNAVGQKMYSFNGMTDALDVNTNGFESGLYMISVKTIKGSMSGRIVVKH